MFQVKSSLLFCFLLFLVHLLKFLLQVASAAAETLNRVTLFSIRGRCPIAHVAHREELDYIRRVDYIKPVERGIIY